MNSSLLTSSMNSSSTAIFETWFIYFYIYMIVCLSFGAILGGFFILIIVLDKTCHTIPMMLVANSCLAQILFAVDIIAISVVGLHNDQNEVYHPDSLCIFRGYLGYVFCGILNYSFLLQAIYRYVTAVYPTCLFWQSARIQMLLVCITWIYGFMFPLAFIFTGDIVYNANNQICQIPLRLSFPLIFVILNFYLMPVSGIQLIYYKLVGYVKVMSERVTTGNSLSRIQRELKMVRRIVIIVTMLVILGLPYTIFILMSFFTSPPIYHFRIAGIFINSSLFIVMIAVFKFTDPLKSSVFKRINLRSETVVPTVWLR